MSLGDPATAPARSDLTFLRRRSRPRAAPPAPAPASSAAPQSGSGRVDYSRPDRHRSAPDAGRPKIDFSRPDRQPTSPPPTPVAPVGSGVDYSRRAAPDSLDLSTPSPAAAPRRAARPALPVHRDAHVHGREQFLLDVHHPTVTLSRVQSGVGHLSVEAVCSADIGDLRLGALYQFRSGGTSTVQHEGGHRFAPSSRRPVIVASREEYERLSVDLRQVGDIERITVYAFSESRTPLEWGGTLVLETFGGGRVEVPLETLYLSTIAVLLSLYNLDGELVVRAEMESITGDVREAARAYGYDRITWRDDRTPVD